jgi:hypothetical protein
MNHDNWILLTIFVNIIGLIVWGSGVYIFAKLRDTLGGLIISLLGSILIVLAALLAKQ